jgi:hypothetical protein
MNKRKIIVYVSGAYVGKDEGRSIPKNVQLARKESIKVWEKGYGVITPHLNTQFFEKDCSCKYDDYMVADCEILARCDVVLMLSNWENSGGAKIERNYALLYNIPVVYSLEELETWYESCNNNTSR